MFEQPTVEEIMIHDPVIRLDDAVKAAGNQTKLAKVLHKARSTVCDWRRQHGGEIPPLYAYRLLQIYPNIKHKKRALVDDSNQT